jgi:tRNA threonylcarbamoyladenosine biosynthesis protein TsaB
VNPAGRGGDPTGSAETEFRPGPDAFTLALDSSTGLGTVAVLRGTSVVAEGQAVMRGHAEERLMPAVAATLAIAGCQVRDVSAIVCGGGPGSFTSLRIAAAIAKGLALGSSAAGRSTPLYAVSSLTLIVAGHPSPLQPGRYLALLDALRGERYAALVEIDADGGMRELESPSGGRIADSDVAALCTSLRARAIGPGESHEATPHARGAARMFPTLFAGPPVSLDAWEPAYGRPAEAQRKWEADHGRALAAERI